MIFNHKVKHNGITYPAGADVPVGGSSEPKKDANEKEEVKPAKAKVVTKKTKK